MTQRRMIRKGYALSKMEGEISMSKYRDELYLDAIASTIGDVYYSNASLKSKIASMRNLCEYYVRRLIKHNPNSDLLLGNKRTKQQLEKAGVTEAFFWKAFDVVHFDGNDASHTKVYAIPTEEDFDRVSKAVVDLQSYLFYDYFKRYQFGSNRSIERSFSLLPPFFRLTVLHQLILLDCENLEIVHKYALAAMKTLGKAGALQLIENEKEYLNSHSIPFTSEDAEKVLEALGPLGYAQFLQQMNGSIYDYLKREIEETGDTFDSMEPKYKNFEEAKMFFLDEGKVEGDSPDVVEFNALMEYIYTGRQECTK